MCGLSDQQVLKTLSERGYIKCINLNLDDENHTLNTKQMMMIEFMMI